MERFASWSDNDVFSEASASFSSIIESREGVAYLPWNHRAASGGDNGDKGYVEEADVESSVLGDEPEAAIANSGSSTMARFSFLGAWKLLSIGLIDAWLTGETGRESREVSQDRARGAGR